MQKLTFGVDSDNLTYLLTLYDQIKVYRSATATGVFAEITTVADRLSLVVGTTVYEYLDVTGAPTFFYKVSFFNSVGPLESDLSELLTLLYIDLQAVRDEGVTSVRASDAKVLQQIETWQAFVERATGNWFYPKAMTLDLDGRNTTVLQLPYPIDAVTSVFINEDFTTALDADEYKVYDGKGLTDKDERRNPRIKLVTTEDSIFTGTGQVVGRNTVWEVGEQNQRVVGTFGYVEPDGSVPAPIEYALLKLVVRGSKKLGLYDAFPAGPVVEEETDRHRVKYADPYIGSKMWPTTGDPEVDQILARYRRPTFVRGPRTLYRRNRGPSLI